VSTLRLFLTDAFLPLTPKAELEWRLIDGTTIGRGRDALASLPKARRTELFLPPSILLQCAVTLPPGAKRQARKLLPHALDPVLLGDPAAQHLAFTATSDRCRVVAIDKGLLTQLIAGLNQARVRPSAIYAADVLIPADGQTLLWYGSGWAQRKGESAYWFDAASPRQCPPLLAAALLDDQPTTLALPPDQDEAELLRDWEATTQRSVSIARGDVLGAPLQSDAINLLQGEFAAGPQLDIDTSRLKPAAWLAGTALAVWALGWVGQWWSWHAEEARLRSGINTAFATAFPGTPIIDARQQLAAKLNAGAATPQANDATTRLIDLAGRFQAPEGVKLVGLSYANNQVKAEYQAKPEQLGVIAQGLSSLGHPEISPLDANRSSITLTLNP